MLHALRASIGVAVLLLLHCTLSFAGNTLLSAITEGWFAAKGILPLKASFDKVANVDLPVPVTAPTPPPCFLNCETQLLAEQQPRGLPSAALPSSDEGHNRSFWAQLNDTRRPKGLGTTSPFYSGCLQFSSFLPLRFLVSVLLALLDESLYQELAETKSWQKHALTTWVTSKQLIECQWWGFLSVQLYLSQAIETICCMMSCSLHIASSLEIVLSKKKKAWSHCMAYYTDQFIQHRSHACDISV